MKNRGGGGRLLLTRNPTKDLYPERPSGVKDLSRPANYSLASGLGRSRSRSRRRIDGRARAFLQRMNHIDAQAFKALDQSAGPANLHPLDLRGRPEAKVNARIAIGNVAGPAAHLVNERARTRFHRNLRADPVAIGFAAARRGRKRSSNRPQRDPMVAIANVVY